MLDQEIKEQCQSLFQKITKDLVIQVWTGEHESADEFNSFIADIIELSPRFTLQKVANEELPLRFGIAPVGEEPRVFFQGIPGGHEFSSLILAILQIGGTPSKLDQTILKQLAGATKPLVFETVVSLDCHNCPDVVQTINALTLVNPNIKHTMIDGNLYPALVQERKIQGVPSVFLNGESFLTGKVEPSQILEKLLSLPSVRTTEQDEGSDSEIYDILVIGGGPGGVASAVYSARKGLKVGILAKKMGGQVKDTMGIENLISVSYTTGPKLSGHLTELLKENGVTLKEFLSVEKIESEGGLKKVFLNSGSVLKSRSIIIATGAKWREINVPGEKEYLGKGVAYCPHCDGPFFKGKDVAVIGGGNSGVEAALDLSGIVKSVTLIEFAPDLKADKVLVDKLKSTANIRIVTNAKTQEIVGAQDKVTGIRFENRETNEVESVALDGVFVQIGLVPNSQFVKDTLECNRFGEILVDEKCRTSVEGIFACGDVTNTPYKQIIIAMGEGAKAGIAAFEYLLTSNHQIAV